MAEKQKVVQAKRRWTWECPSCLYEHVITTEKIPKRVGFQCLSCFTRATVEFSDSATTKKQ